MEISLKVEINGCTVIFTKVDKDCPNDNDCKFFARFFEVIDDLFPEDKMLVVFGNKKKVEYLMDTFIKGQFPSDLRKSLESSIT